MSTHNICFYGEIRKILCRYPLLPGAMHAVWSGIFQCIDIHAFFKILTIVYLHRSSFIIWCLFFFFFSFKSCRYETYVRMFNRTFWVFPPYGLGEIRKIFTCQPIRNKLSRAIFVYQMCFFSQPKNIDNFLFLHENICCWYSLEVPSWGTSDEYTHNIMFSLRNNKIFLEHPFLSGTMWHMVLIFNKLQILYST